MLKELMLPAEVKLLKPNPAGCWHCVPAMMHGLAVLCGPSMLFVKGVPAPGKSVRVAAEAGPGRAKVTAVAATPINHCIFIRLSLCSPWRFMGCSLSLALAVLISQESSSDLIQQGIIFEL